MKRLLPFLFLPLLCACERKPGTFAINMQNPTNAQYKDMSNYTFIGAGQSNMAFEHLGTTFNNSVNVASPGTTIAEWQPGQPLYNAMRDAVKAHGPSSVVLFWQGEAEGLGFDVNHTPDYDWPNWEIKFLTMMRALRRDVGFDVPVIYVQIGEVDKALYPSLHWSDVQREQMACEGALPAMAMVSAADLFPDTGDGVHYGQDQYVTMQNRMYMAWEHLQ
jgi:hypothetical protein